MAVHVQMAPARSIAPIPIIIGDTYFSNAKLVKAMNTKTLVGIVCFKKALILPAPAR